MIPERTLSTTPVPAPYLEPDDREKTLTIDYEFGGVALRDASQGLRVKVWTFRLTGEDVTAEALDVPATVLFSGAGITEIAGAFDQNMNPAVAFMQAGTLKLYWYDSLAEEQVITDFDGHSPKVCMDDKRRAQTLLGNNDVIFAYIRDGVLYNRTQRYRYEVEDELATIGDGFTFDRMGMNTINRLQFQFTPIPVAA
jgi:hypothetical protein